MATFQAFVAGFVPSGTMALCMIFTTAISTAEWHRVVANGFQMTKFHAFTALCILMIKSGCPKFARINFILYILRFKAVLKLKNYPTTFYFTIVYYILGYNQLSNSCSMAADDPAHVRACSTASTPACTVPDLLSFLINHQKVPMGRRASNSRWIRGC